MPQINRMDRLTNKLNERVGRISARLGSINKNTTPYRQIPKTPRERFFDYAQQTPESIDFARQTFGDAPVMRYVEEMEKLRGRYENA